MHKNLIRAFAKAMMRINPIPNLNEKMTPFDFLQESLLGRRIGTDRNQRKNKAVILMLLIARAKSF